MVLLYIHIIYARRMMLAVLGRRQRYWKKKNLVMCWWIYCIVIAVNFQALKVCVICASHWSHFVSCLTGPLRLEACLRDWQCVLVKIVSVTRCSKVVQDGVLNVSFVCKVKLYTLHSLMVGKGKFANWSQCTCATSCNTKQCVCVYCVKCLTQFESSMSVNW